MSEDRLVVTKHAVHRYVERVKPALDYRTGKVELERLLGLCSAPSSVVPGWAKHLGWEGYSLFVELSDGIIAVVVNGHVTTILCRGLSGADELEARRVKKRKKRRQRRFEAERDSAAGAHKHSTLDPDGLRKPGKKEWDRA